MIKIEDLMVGDWVLDNGTPTRVTLALMSLINLDIRNCEPIPITHEILEKNGWHYDDIDGEWYGCGLNLGGYNPEEYTILDGRRIRYVHELQHFLRDCKINKEIIL